MGISSAVCLALLGQQALPGFTPTSAYITEVHSGFTIRINPEAFADAEGFPPAIALLRLRLDEMSRKVPAPALKTLRRVPVWVEKDDKVVPCMCYHPSAVWLREHGLNPDKEKGIELSNLRNFALWSIDQPMMVFHEFAHGYHDLTFGFEGKTVLDAYKHAMDEHLYDEVLYYNGPRKKAYAATNQQEYFAELTEALFGYNDFFPFTRPELIQHDPVGYAMVRKCWGMGD